ncbi:MAG: thioredoxin family protein [Planctomycetes bacterium]|nr:thioredoxin family protein [Planctomycetota bacterium]
MKTVLLTAVLSLASTVAAFAAPVVDDAGVWHADFDEAVAVAKEQGKDLFVDFTGSDWCIWCHRLHDEVFQYDTFLTGAQEHFVLVALDFPNSDEAKAAVPNPERNDELQAKYGIQGFPTCLLMNTDGVVFGRMGYQEGGPEKYIDDLRATTTKGKALLVELEKLQKDYASATDKTPVVEKAVGMLADMDAESPGVSIVASIAAEALKLDPENTAGLKLSALEALLRSGQADDAARASARAMDPKNELGLLEQVVKAQVSVVRDDVTARAAIKEIESLLELGKFHDAGEVKSMAAMAAMWCEGPLDDHAHAIELATKAKAIEGEVEEYVDAMLTQILG